MTYDPAKSKRADELFDSLCELPPVKRERALEQEGDSEVRALVRRLLTAYDSSRADPTDVTPPAFGAPGAPAIPERVGPYRIDRRLGAGGMGVVYLAHRVSGESAPTRGIALKVLRSSDSEHLRHRFQREADVLRRLDHPSICRFLEVGSALIGGIEVPYIAMEFVEGETLIDHAMHHALGDRERIELLARVCDPVAHAHRAGVVHRDLKPGNVLVTRGGDGDEIGLPKVVDFGVARAVGDDLATLTATRSGSLVGTIAYMSPEQVSGNSQEVDERSDVYSLGVLLFELLTGRLPYRLSGLPLVAAVRVIQEEEPSRLGTTVDRLRGPLEHVVAKALEKEPRRRYPTADALAADLRRYLTRGSVRARPPTMAHQMRKLARRHRGLAVAVVGVVAALSIGLVTTVWFALGERDARQHADAEAWRANRELYRAQLETAGRAIADGDALAARAHLERAPAALRGWEWEHLVSQIMTGDLVLEVSDDLAALGAEAVNVDMFLALSDDGRALTWVASDKNRRRTTFVVWELPAGRRLASDQFDGITRVTRSGDRMVVLGVDGLTVHALPSTHVLKTIPLPGMTGELKNFAVDSGLVVVMGPTGSLHVDISTGSVEQADAAQMFFKLDVVASARRGVASADMSGIFVFDLGDPASGTQLATGQHGTRRARLSADGLRVACPNADGRVSQWDVSDLSAPRLLHEFGEHRQGVITVAYSADGTLLATGGEGRSITLHSAISGKRLATFGGHEDFVTALSLTPDARLLASAGKDGTVRVYTVQADDPHILRHGAYVYAAGIEPSGQRLIVGDPQGGLWFHDAASLTPITRISPGQGESIATALAFDPGRPRVAVARQAGNVSILDLVTGEWRTTLDTAELPRAAYASDGRSLLALADPQPGSSGSLLWRWDAETFELLQSRTVPDSNSNQFGVDPRGQWIAVSHPQGVQLLDAETLEPVATLPAFDGEGAWCFAFSPDGTRLAAAEGTTVTVWELPSQVEQVTFTAHQRTLFTLCWSEDGSRLLTGAEDNAIRVWDTESWGELATLHGHTDYVWDLSRHPTRDAYVSAGGDGTVRLWDTRTSRGLADEQRTYDVQRETVADLVSTLVGLPPAEASARLASDTSLGPREREVAEQWLFARRIEGAAVGVVEGR